MFSVSFQSDDNDLANTGKVFDFETAVEVGKKGLKWFDNPVGELSEVLGTPVDWFLCEERDDESPISSTQADFFGEVGKEVEIAIRDENGVRKPTGFFVASDNYLKWFDK